MDSPNGFTKASDFPNIHGKKVKVIKIVTTDGVMCLPFEDLDTWDENLELSKKYVGKIGIASSVNSDGSLSETFTVTFDDGKIGEFIPEELELVEG